MSASTTPPASSSARVMKTERKGCAIAFLKAAIAYYTRPLRDRQHRLGKAAKPSRAVAWPRSLSSARRSGVGGLRRHRPAGRRDAPPDR